MRGHPIEDFAQGMTFIGLIIRYYIRIYDLTQNAASFRILRNLRFGCPSRLTFLSFLVYLFYLFVSTPDCI